MQISTGANGWQGVIGVDVSGQVSTLLQICYTGSAESRWSVTLEKCTCDGEHHLLHENASDRL